MNFSSVSKVLAQPVRFRVISRYLARIGLVIIILRIIPTLVTWYSQNWSLLFNQSLMLCVLAALCIPFSRIQAPQDIRDNEILVISSSSFFLAALAGGLPFTAEGLSFFDALFESVSAVTTTGLSTVSHIEQRSTGFLFERSWMQWYGGLGVVVFSVGLLFLDKGIAARRLAMGDNTDNRDLLGNARSHSFKILFLYGAITCFAIVCLLVIGLKPMSAITHALSGVSTGGFSIYDNSLMSIPSWSKQFFIVFISMLGAISLPFYYRLLHNGVKEFSYNLEIKTLLILILIVMLMLFINMHQQGDLLDRAKTAFVLALSAQTTTGFSNVDIGVMDNASKLSLIFSMMTGGSVGSTAGGIKILRLLIALRLFQYMIQRTALPAHAVLEKQLAGDRLEADEIEKALMLVLIFAGTVLISWMPFLFAGYDPLNSLFDVVSACSTTGLSTGVTNSSLEPMLKVILMFDMLLGRVEFLAFLVILYPRTWFKVRG